MDFAPSDRRAPSEGQGAPRVLIVEADRSFLAVLARRVGEGGYRIATAESVSAALAELQRVRVDLVVAELRISGTGGVDLVRMIREDPLHRELPILLITGKSDAEGAVLAYKSGADTVIAKPFHFEVLVARIGREIERARSLEKLRSDNKTLDARVIERTIALGEMRDRWLATDAERRRLEEMVRQKAD